MKKCGCKYSLSCHAAGSYWQPCKRDYSLSSDQTFVFMILGENPQTTNAFMAVLGQHALALSHEEGSSFQAVRMKASITPSPAVTGSRWSWEVVYSTVPEGSQRTALADNLEAELCTFLTMQATELYKWKRGDGVQPDPSNGSRIWTIFDCGLVGAPWQWHSYLPLLNDSRKEWPEACINNMSSTPIDVNSASLAQSISSEFVHMAVQVNRMRDLCIRAHAISA